MPRDFATLGSLELQPPFIRVYKFLHFFTYRHRADIRPYISLLVRIVLSSRSQLKRYFAEFLHNGS